MRCRCASNRSDRSCSDVVAMTETLSRPGRCQSNPRLRRRLYFDHFAQSHHATSADWFLLTSPGTADNCWSRSESARRSSEASLGPARWVAGLTWSTAVANVVASGPTLPSGVAAAPRMVQWRGGAAAGACSVPRWSSCRSGS
jgi:hypothetical protein